MERVAWSDALDHVAHRFQHIIARDGPGAVAFYLSGQLLTEDYYVANKLMKGFIGSANVDTNSRLCMASSVAGHRRAFGADTVPGCYEDLDQADLAGAGRLQCGVVPSGAVPAHARQQAGARRPHRRDRPAAHRYRRGCRTVPGAEARHRYRAVCGTAGAISPTMARSIAIISSATPPVSTTRSRAPAAWPAACGATALATGLSEADVATFFQMFANTPRVVTLYSQGVNQSAQGTDKVNAILNCHLATGRIGKIGASPFSLTGQPNAMGGREVGGLANQLAAHMAFTPPDIDRVRRFWKAPRIATHEGLKAVQMFEAIARGEIKALWVMGTNPAVSLPDADAARAALKKLELFVVSENVRSNDTVDAGAHVLLPARGLGREIRHGDQFGAAHLAPARVSRRPRRGQARLVDCRRSRKAARLWRGVRFQFGRGRLPRARRAVGVREQRRPRFRYRRIESGVGRSVSTRMAPVQWPIRLDAQPQARFFAEGGFFANDRKARFIAPEIPALRTETTAARPLRLNTGRIRDQWHTMTRTGRQPAARPAFAGAVRRSSSRRCGPIRRRRRRFRAGDVPITANARSGSSSANGSSAACCSRRFTGARPMPPAARVGALVAPYTDPFSGQPENKATPASIAPYEYVFRRFCAVAQAARNARACLVGARRRQWRLRLSVRRQCRSRRAGNPG